MIDQKYMLRCFDLAARSIGKNIPNPMVGAVIVYKDQIIGEGFHEYFGGPHAEINAFNSLKPEHRPLLKESVMYVSLEPCSHHGKTPPCVDAIIRSGIPMVVIGTKDPNPLVSGSGIKKLTDAGIEVFMSNHFREAERLLIPFRAHLQKRPYIILKVVKSKDHFIGKKGQKIWLSNDKMKVISHMWRSESDAILVGKNTVLTDNPSLTTRYINGKNPVRIVIDQHLECNHDLNVFSYDSKVYHINGSLDKTQNHIIIQSFDFSSPWLKTCMEYLFSQNIFSLMVEGGAYTHQKFIEANLWDVAYIVETPHLLMEGIQAPDITGYQYQKPVKVGDNTVTKIFREKI
jgi:diaminohydroxyphosphoribosylaminopyrimidine deaminase/5-amino-6-(5-phosphoribosylamino)uracil reductase